tara:strand:+ start:50 stop:379 length:330 start_codon:yes stop_codon:yes gene_type:complete
MKKIILFLISCLIVNACATSYTLAPRYEEFIGNNKYELSFRGNSYTSEEKLKGFFSKRASKLCKNTGGNFKILKQRTEAVNYKDRTYADFGKSIDMELRVFGLIECINI